jgi:hypothetical protein
VKKLTTRNLRELKGRKQVNVRVRKEIYDAISRAAEEQHRSRNALCNLIFEQWLANRLLDE